MTRRAVCNMQAHPPEMARRFRNCCPTDSGTPLQADGEMGSRGHGQAYLPTGQAHHSAAMHSHPLLPAMHACCPPQPSCSLIADVGQQLGHRAALVPRHHIAVRGLQQQAAGQHRTAQLHPARHTHTDDGWRCVHTVHSFQLAPGLPCTRCRRGAWGHHTNAQAIAQLPVA